MDDGWISHLVLVPLAEAGVATLCLDVAFILTDIQ